MTDQTELILGNYWPIIEAARKVRAHYDGSLDGIRKVCPDASGELIEALNLAERTLMVERTQDDDRTE